MSETIELNVFDGGINTRLEPHFLAPNQAVELVNCDVSSGIIRPFSNDVNTNQIASKSFYLFNDQVISGDEERSYVEYDRSLFYSNGKQAKWSTDGINFVDLGVTSPSNPPVAEINEGTYTVVVSTGGVTPAGTQLYKIVEDDTDIFTQEAEVLFNNSSVVFTFTEAKNYKLYRLVDNKFILVAERDGAGDLEELQTTSSEIGTITDLSVVLNTKYKQPSTMPAHIHSLGQPSLTPDNNITWPIVYTGYLGSSAVGVLSKETYVFSPVTNKYIKVTHSEATELLSAWSSNKNSGRGGVFTINGDTYRWGVGVFSPYNIGGLVIQKIGSGSISFTEINNMLYFAGAHKVYGNIFYVFTYNTYMGKTGKAFTYNGGPSLGSTVLPSIPLPSNVALVDVIFINSTEIYLITNPVDHRAVPVNQVIIYRGTLGSTSYEVVHKTTDKLAFSFSLFGDDVPTQNYAGSNMMIGNNACVLFKDYVLTLTPTLNDAVKKYPYSGGFKFRPQNRGSCIVKDGVAYVTEENKPYSSGSLMFTYDRAKMYTIQLAVEDAEGLGDQIQVSTLSGTYSYVYTYCDAGGTNESAPSEATEAITVDVGHIFLSDLDIGGNPDTKPYIRLYRIGGANKEYRLVEELASSTATYLDTKADVELTDVLSTYGTVDAPPSGKYLVEHNGRLWCAAHLDNDYTRLYYSDAGAPQTWAADQYIQLPDVIYGLGSTANGLVVGLEDKTYVVLGYDSASFTLRLIDGAQGCVGHSSIQPIDNNIIYVSKYGICICDGTKVSVVSGDSLGKFVYTPTFSATINKQYYVSYDKEVLVYDYSIVPKLYTLHNPAIKGLLGIGSELNYSDGVFLYTMHSGGETSDNTMLYLSPHLTEGRLNNLKEYDKVRITYEGTFTLSIIIDDNIILTKDLSSFTRETEVIVLPNNNIKGYYLQFRVEGVFTLYAIEYSVQGRDNV
jgi:hypothetical protein